MPHVRKGQSPPSGQAVIVAEQRRLLTPVRESLSRLAAVVAFYGALCFLVLFSSYGLDFNALGSALPDLAEPLESAFGWIVPTSLAYIALAHLAIIGGQLDPEKHRGYLLALSTSSSVVVSGLVASSVLVAFSWTEDPKKLVLLIPVVPLLVVISIVGVQVGRFNMFNAEQELKYVESQSSRVVEKLASLSPAPAGEAWGIVVIHVGVLAATFSAAALLSRTVGLTGSVVGGLAVFGGLLLTLSLMAAAVHRNSTDKVLSSVAGPSSWLLTVPTILALLLSLGDFRIWPLALMLLPVLATQALLTPVAGRAKFSLLRVIDAVGAKTLRAQEQRLTGRIAEIQKQMNPVVEQRKTNPVVRLLSWLRLSTDLGAETQQDSGPRTSKVH
jgi:hypothetical protein